MQLRNKITVVRNIRIHHHSFKRKAQNAVVLSLGCGRNGKNNTQIETGKEI